MFWDSWIPAKYLIKPEIYAVEANFQDGQPHFSWLHVTSKKNKAQAGASEVSGTNFRPSHLKLKKGAPVTVVITGSSVILKKVHAEPADSVAEVIRKNMPTLNSADFCIQLYRQSSQPSYLAFCRLDLMKQVLALATVNAVEVVDIHIGSTAVLGLQNLWNAHRLIETAHERFSLVDNEIAEITPIESDPTLLSSIGELNVPRGNLVNLAAALIYLTQEQITDSQDPALAELHNTHLNRNRLRVATLFLVAVALLLSMANALVFSNSFKENGRLTAELAQFEARHAEINQVVTDYQQNRNLIEKAGILSENNLSEFADRLCVTVPVEVALTELLMNPPANEDTDTDSLTTFESGKLLIRGKCRKSFIVNEWVNKLKAEDFIKEVRMDKFSYNTFGDLPNFQISVITAP